MTAGCSEYGNLDPRRIAERTGAGPFGRLSETR